MPRQRCVSVAHSSILDSQENVREVFETATRAALNTKTKKKGGCSVL